MTAYEIAWIVCDTLVLLAFGYSLYYMFMELNNRSIVTFLTNTFGLSVLEQIQNLERERSCWKQIARIW